MSLCSPMSRDVTASKSAITSTWLDVVCFCVRATRMSVSASPVLLCFMHCLRASRRVFQCTFIRDRISAKSLITSIFATPVSFHCESIPCCVCVNSWEGIITPLMGRSDGVSTTGWRSRTLCNSVDERHTTSRQKHLFTHFHAHGKRRNFI